MITIAALGNPGEMYEHTRHNIGWLVAEALIKKHGLPGLVMSSQYCAHISEGVLHGAEVNIILPASYMNNSGIPVKKYLHACAQKPEELVVIHDDVDLPFGDIKISKNRGAGGHNGVKSIIDTLGTQDFTRIRIGVRHVGVFGVSRRPTGANMQRYVTGKLSGGELRKIDVVADAVDVALKVLVEEGVEKAMTTCN